MSVADKLHDNLSRLGLAVVHQAHPTHRVAGFRLSVAPAAFASLAISSSRRLFAASSISAGAPSASRSGREVAVKYRPIFLQIGFPHPGRTCPGLCRLFLQDRAGIG